MSTDQRRDGAGEIRHCCRNMGWGFLTQWVLEKRRDTEMRPGRPFNVYGCTDANHRFHLTEPRVA